MVTKFCFLKVSALFSSQSLTHGQALQTVTLIQSEIIEQGLFLALREIHSWLACLDLQELDTENGVIFPY